MSADVISETTRMICASEAEHDIATTLGVSTDQPLRPTWIDHVYSCEYQYATGSLRLSVKQLTNRASTDFYFANLASQLGRRQELEGLGQGAFTTTDDSVVVRKDDKVLVVDPRGLPARFGVPPDVRANVAVSVAATIMGCWNGE